MDFWLDQVQAVDFVISIANTTIHGAGGLGKPTFCLLSTFADWRWIHPDVWKVVTGILLWMLDQKKFNEWDQVISECNQWLSKVTNSGMIATLFCYSRLLQSNNNYPTPAIFYGFRNLTIPKTASVISPRILNKYNSWSRINFSITCVISFSILFVLQ